MKRGGEVRERNERKERVQRHATRERERRTYPVRENSQRRVYRQKSPNAFHVSVFDGKVKWSKAAILRFRSEAERG